MPHVVTLGGLGLGPEGPATSREGWFVASPHAL